MDDQARSFDDLSGLWGPDDTGSFEVAPLRPATPCKGPAAASPDEASTNAVDDRVTALENQIRCLGDTVDALRVDALGEVDQRMCRLEARLDEVAVKAGDVDDILSRRFTAVEDALLQGVSGLSAAIDAHELDAVSEHRVSELRDELQEELVRQLAEVRSEATEAVDRTLAAAEATLQQRLESLSSTSLGERLARAERNMALLAESLQAYRVEATRTPTLEAIRDDLQSAADEIACRTVAQLTQRLRELATQRTHETVAERLAELAALEEPARRRAADADRIAEMDQRDACLADLPESHGVQSVIGWEIESLRCEVIGPTSAQLADGQADLAEMTENGSGADAERHRLEASRQQPMPGL